MNKDLKFGVVVFPGSNCDDDIVHVLGDVYGAQVIKIWHKEYVLPDLDGIILPGGFSYGDYLRSGAIARYAHIMPAIQKFADQGGFVWGICNGFQILCEAGLLPGVLLPNRDQKFICDNIYLRTRSHHSMITENIPVNKILKIPIAHADGRYYADDNTVQLLFDQNQVLFQYCSAAGILTEIDNVNGSVMQIAGICNEARNVYGMMPHPERAAESLLGNLDGSYLIESLLSSIRSVPNRPGSLIIS